MPKSLQTKSEGGDWAKLVAAMLLSGAVAGGGGGLTGALGATSLIEYRIDRLEEQLESTTSMQRQVDQLDAETVRVDERRAADMRLVEQRLLAIDRRLESIEAAVSPRRAIHGRE